MFLQVGASRLKIQNLRMAELHSYHQASIEADLLRFNSPSCFGNCCFCSPGFCFVNSHHGCYSGISNLRFHHIGFDYRHLLGLKVVEVLMHHWYYSNQGPAPRSLIQASPWAHSHPSATNWPNEGRIIELGSMPNYYSYNHRHHLCPCLYLGCYTALFVYIHLIHHFQLHLCPVFATLDPECWSIMKFLVGIWAIRSRRCFCFVASWYPLSNQTIAFINTWNWTGSPEIQ